MEDDAPRTAHTTDAAAMTPLQRMMMAQQGAHTPAAASSSSASAASPLSPANAKGRVIIHASRRTAPASGRSHAAASAASPSTAAASSLSASASPSKPAAHSSLLGGSLLGPSSFSSSLAAHPFLQQSASPAAASSLAVPLSLAGTAEAPRGKNKRTSDQFVSEHIQDPQRLPAQPEHKPRGADSNADVDIGNSRGVIPLSQDDEEEGMADEPKAKPVEYAAKGGDDEDSSFLALLNKLAHLELPTRGSEMEDCPICSLKFTLADFAAHVYMCIKKLDGDEKLEQERLDAKLATEMAFSEDNRAPGGHRRRGLQPYGQRSITPEAVEAEEEQLLEKFASNKEEHCPHGKQCTRTDFKHFVLKWHPEVECPLCGAFFAVPEVNAHVTLCLDMPKESKSPSAIKKQNSDAMGDASMNGSSSKPSGGIFSSAPVHIPSHAGLSAAAAAAAASGHAGIPARRAGARKLGQRSASASGMGSGSQQDDLLGSPPLDDDDDAEADDELDLDDTPAPPQRTSGGMLAPTSAAAAASSSSGSGGPLHRSTSDCSLSLAQAAAVASLVLKKRGAGAPTGTVKSGEKDPSLLELLNTFSSLGFTRENLEALHAQHQKEQDEKGGAGGAM